MPLPLSWNPLLLFFLASAATAAPVDFARDVRPVLEHQCYQCHGPEKQKSGLRLDIKAAAFKGGDKHAPDIIPGKPKDSPLIQMVSADDDDRMPPKGKGLSAEEIATLTAWIEQGAVWPEGIDKARLADKRDHWSFKPLTNPAPPSTKDTAWPRNDIDRFILARLEKEGLHPAPEAAPSTWLRRVYLDLTGLPPTPEQAQAFSQSAIRNPQPSGASQTAEGSPKGTGGGPDQSAMEKVVDDLLNSERYGERWAQHWLDVVRYADTHGFEVNTERPNAWPYRDYVIRAFNKDTPYNQFIREQLAGDALGQDAATGFLVTASVLLSGQIGKDEPSKRLARQDSIDEIVTNIGQSFLGLSIGCARCHDHKFDPVSQRDYYAMQAFVAGVEYQDRDLHTPEAEALRQQAKDLKRRIAETDQKLSSLVPLAFSGTTRPAVDARMNTDRFPPMVARRVRFTILETNSLEPCIDEIECIDPSGHNVALAAMNVGVASSGDTVVPHRHELAHVNDGLYGNSHSWMSNEKGKGWLLIEFPGLRKIDRVVWGRDREGKYTDRLAINYRIEVAGEDDQWHLVADASDRAASPEQQPKKKKKKGKEKPPAVATDGLSQEEAKQARDLMTGRNQLQAKMDAAENGSKAFAGTFRTPDVIHLLNRGDPEQPKDEVRPAVPGSLGRLELPKDATEQDRRKALAEWIISPQNPLTARVMVNRIWQGHFGTGLVDTPSDFGHNGTRPSHPELLDWLAQDFMRNGWSIKHLHKLIVLSAAYRQSATISDSEAAPIADSNAPQSQLSGQSATRNPQLIDSDDRLLWHYPSRRLESETMRDTMLAVSGRLNLKMYGRGFDLFDKRGGLTGFRPVESYKGEGLRRMIYAHKVRREREAVFGAFDCPDAGQSTARRRESTTPIQALDLFNSRFTIDESEALAARVKTEAGEDLAKQIRRTYQLALNRDPGPDELHDAVPAVRQFGLATLCRAMFNSNEFLFLP